MKKTIIVSGTSRGLGLDIARSLLEQGCQVAGFARKRTEGIARLEQAHPSTLLFQELDATDSRAQRTFVEAVRNCWGRIDGLINNAAIGQDHLLANIDERSVTSIISVNLTSVILLTRAVVKKMLLEEDGGRIVTITSICASRGYAGLTVYSATKAALEGFTRTLAREVGTRGILVNAIAPGFFSSEMSAVLTADQVSAIVRRTPTERLTTPHDVLPLIHLLMLGNLNITGQVLAVDGGAGI